MRSKTSLFLLSVLATVASSVSMADALVNVKTEVVRYDDIRLISDVGAAVMYVRLRSAAERACGGPVDPMQITQQKRFRTCVDDAVSKAVSEVNSPVLSKYFDAKRGAPSPARIDAPTATAVAKTP